MKTRSIIENMKRYTPSDGRNLIRLDANEVAFSEVYSPDAFDFNRYPDSESKSLKNAIACLNGVGTDQIICGNGSSEMIELLLKTYINPGDLVLGFEPSFVMYKIFTELYNGVYEGVRTQDYIMDMDVMISKAKVSKPKIIFICNPNNPTGATVSKIDIEKLLKQTDALVVVDEAYIEFGGQSMINRVDGYDNLIVLRTFSKAWGLAALRLGYLVSNSGLVDAVNTAKSPYNLNAFSQSVGIQAIKNRQVMLYNVQKIVSERSRVFKGLSNFGVKTYKSFANFIYFEAPLNLLDVLKEKGILIRSFGDGTYRVTIGTVTENNLFLESMIQLLKVREEVIYESKCTS